MSVRFVAARQRLLSEDVAAMIGDAEVQYEEDRVELAKDIITVVREAVLQEIESQVRSALVQVRKGMG